MLASGAACNPCECWWWWGVAGEGWGGQREECPWFIPGGVNMSLSWFRTENALQAFAQACSA